MQCPNCQREYHEKPLRCACGYDFQTGAIYAPPTGGVTPLPSEAHSTTLPPLQTAHSVSPPVVGSPAQLADRGTRLGARLIDWLVQVAPVFMLIGDESPSSIVFTVLGILAIAGLQWYMLSMQGQSIGKLALKIKIVKITDGTNGGFVTNVLVREIANGFLSIFPFYGLVDSLFIFRQDQRCIHDHLASTRVVVAE